MLKRFFIAALLFCASVSFAQQTAAQDDPPLSAQQREQFIANAQQLREQLAAIAARQLIPQILPAANKPKPLKANPAGKGTWQFVAVLGTHKNEEKLSPKLIRMQLHRAMQEGHLVRAIILPEFLRERPSKRDVMAEILTLLPDGRRASERYRISRELSPYDVMDILMQFLADAPVKADYTGVLVSAHGSGKEMAFNHAGSDLEVVDVLQAARAHGVRIDVLDLSSCFMGSWNTMSTLIAYDNISYVIASANYSGMNGFGPVTANFLAYPPRELAQQVLLKTQENFKSLSWVTTFTYNLVLWNLNVLHPIAKKWRETWFPFWNPLATFQPLPSDCPHGVWQSIIKIDNLLGVGNHQGKKSMFNFLGDIRPIIADFPSVPESMLDSRVSPEGESTYRDCKYISDELKSDVLEQTAIFREALNPARIMQFCYSRPNKTFYTTDFYQKQIPPENSACIHSMGLNSSTAWDDLVRDLAFEQQP